ncbi:hypothetical protein GCM10007886_48720 [Methylobacterium gregans]|uniref:Uncharacterized protein n=1 Tax=Methylobacterium gregans TaxID=374424 RepID=A0AA37HS42_9HYPH|nr:hypothetical protein [Methylobacterium gregans]GJD79927.1 hypothetical protein NBEOAGPD_3158 [Methylobacterium gregans]GLS56686.1 hypothetical protein GCM10007886_48720 [Methylobacterium gregans]
MPGLLEALQHLAETAVQEPAGGLSAPIAEQPADNPAQAVVEGAGRRALARRGRGGLFCAAQQLRELVAILLAGEGEEAQERRHGAASCSSPAVRCRR